MGSENCPFCGQEIDTEATKCFFCGAFLDEESVDKRLEQLQKEDNKKPAHKIICPLVLKVTVVGILIFIAIFSSKSLRKPSEANLSSESTVSLKAKVNFTGAQFVISNNDSFDWTNVELQIKLETIGSNFSLRIPKIPAGKTHTIRAAEFTEKNGACFDPYSMKPEKFRIWCDTPTRKIGSYYAGWE